MKNCPAEIAVAEKDVCWQHRAAEYGFWTLPVERLLLQCSWMGIKCCPISGSWILETWGFVQQNLLVLKRGNWLQCRHWAGQTVSFQLLISVILIVFFTNTVKHTAWRLPHPSVSVSCVPVYFLTKARYAPTLNDFCLNFLWWLGQKIIANENYCMEMETTAHKGRGRLWEPDTQLRERRVPKPTVGMDLEWILTHAAPSF